MRKEAPPDVLGTGDVEANDSPQMPPCSGSPLTLFPGHVAEHVVGTAPRWEPDLPIWAPVAPSVLPSSWRQRGCRPCLGLSQP